MDKKVTMSLNEYHHLARKAMKIEEDFGKENKKLKNKIEKLEIEYAKLYSKYCHNYQKCGNERNAINDQELIIKQMKMVAESASIKDERIKELNNSLFFYRCIFWILIFWILANMFLWNIS